MIINYYKFLDFIFEAYSVEQSKQKADEFMLSIYKSKAVASKKAGIKKREVNKEDLPITNDEWKQITQEISRLKAEKKQEELDSITDEKFLRVMEILNLINTEGKLTEEETEKVEEQAKNDPFYLRLQEITKNNPEMIDYFIRLFYRDYKNFDIELDTTKDDNDYDSVRNSLGAFLYYKDDDKIEWNQQNEFGGFGSSLTMFNQLDKTIQDKILNSFDKYKKMQDEQLKKPKGDRVPGFDMLSNDIRDMKIESYADMLLDRLPTGVVDEKNPSINAPNLLAEYRKLKDNDPLKIKIKQTLSKLVTILLDNGVSFESKRQEVKDRDGKVIKDKNDKPVYQKIFPEVEKQFKMRKGTRDDPQEDKSLEGFITRVESKIQGLSNVGVERFYNIIDEVNEKYGKQNGAEVIFVNDKKSDKPIIVIQVKTSNANWFLHNNRDRKKIQVKDEETGESKSEWDSGRLTPTGHCIAYPPGSNRWNSYMKDPISGTYNRKLYYVYNFNLDVSDQMFPFGIIVDEDGKVASAHRKDDTGIATTVEKTIEEWGLDFDSIFTGLTPEEKERRILKTQAQKKIQEKNIPIDNFKKYLEYADPNIGGGIPLLNSVEEGSLEKVNLLAQYNADFNEPASILEKAIHYYFDTRNKVYDAIVSKLLEERIVNIEGSTKNLGHNPISAIKSYLKTGSYQRLKYLLSKNINFKVYDPSSICLEYVNTVDDILLLLNYGLRINREVNEDPVYKVMFPKKIVDAAFILTSKEILNKIPAKKDLSPRDVSCHEIFSHALIWSVETNNFEYFKMVLDISKQRLDAGENDFIVTFLNTDLDIPERFENYLEIKTDEIYEE